MTKKDETVSDETIKAMVLTGKTDIEISQELGMSLGYLKHRRYQAGIPNPANRPGRPRVELDVELIAKLLERGLSFAEVASVVGVKTSLIRDRCRSLGLTSKFSPKRLR